MSSAEQYDTHGWKEIAALWDVPVPTARRWGQRYKDVPVHRVSGHVHGNREELLHWKAQRALRKGTKPVQLALTFVEEVPEPSLANKEVQIFPPPVLPGQYRLPFE